MRILVLGGTEFLGRAVVEAALVRGDDVTLFNRGLTGPELHPEAERPGVDEGAAVAQLEEETEEHRGPAYGALRALCEQVVGEVYGGRATVVRPGLIAGPWDPTGRFTYWPARIATGGEVLAPGPREAAVQVIDARDLAGWMLRLLDADTAGVFNAAGPERPLTMERVLEECRRVTARVQAAVATLLVYSGDRSASVGGA